MKVFLTTGEVAAILGVTRATVVHWINSGKLKAVKTQGKHNRIMKEDLRALLPEVFDARGLGVPVSQYCWEYFTTENEEHVCEKCLVYRTRAAYCYKLADEVGHKGVFCSVSCKKCDYYKLVTKGEI